MNETIKDPLRGRTVKNQTTDMSAYEDDYRYIPGSPNDHWSTKSTIEMLSCLEQNPKIELEARVLGFKGNGLRSQRMERSGFLESFGSKTIEKKLNEFNFREWDNFSVQNGLDNGGTVSGPIGDDFTPLLGGPFYKNLYYYTDYLRMHVDCFYAYHHDPIAKALISITRDFVLGTGFEVQCLDESRKGVVAKALWKAFEDVNNLHHLIDEMCVELSIYGENLIYWLPNNQAKIIYNLQPSDTVPYGLIPRVRLIDPSNMVEIVTYPEDITRPLFYVWLTPTQYQLYSSGLGNQQTQGMPVQPTLKFIYQQIPATQIKHYKINSVSNEKRGRSDLFPVLSYLKRLRDTVNYSLISLQKNSAWSIDTTIKGDQSDLDGYVAAQNAEGTIPAAGSEFVHTEAIMRQYLGNQHISAPMSDTFNWCLSMICAGLQVPTNFLGTHISGSSTRASAIVATEPVIKKFEKRRNVIRRVIQDMWDKVMNDAGLQGVQCSIIFPEMISQDRSQKLQDLMLAQTNGWFSRKRCASNAAKEMGESNFDFANEEKDIKEELPLAPPAPMQPLTKPGMNPNGVQMPKSSDLTAADRMEIHRNGTKL